jgi:ABC-2 type transport system permease protein
MNTGSTALRDTATMLRRDIKHSLRNIAMTVTVLVVPIIMLALFVYVFGGTLSAGLRGAYITFIAPAIIIVTVASGCQATALNLCMDMNEGIINRFRTMAISRASVLTGAAFGSLIRTLITVGILIGVTLLMGFRPTVGPIAWLEALGIVILFAFAVTWMGVLFGLVGKTPSGASSLSLIIGFILPFTSSAYTPTSSMASGVRWFAEHQPLTPVIDTVRGLLLGTPVGDSAIIAVAWCVGIALVGYLWSRAVYNRNTVARNTVA